MNKLLLALAFGGSVILSGCGESEKSDTVVIERETTVRESAPEESSGDSLSISVDEDGGSIEIRAEDE